jgi:DNA invertase Pin-like site-specific DNA recombinase
MTTAAGYCRVSTAEQGESGYGLAAQKSAIHAECERRGWAFTTMFTDVASGGSTKRRPDLLQCIDLLCSGEAEVLVVAKLDRLSRSLADFAEVVKTSRTYGWSIVALDIGVDTSTANGELVANIIMALAQWERRIISTRTTEALAQARQQGVKLGRPSRLSQATADTIVVLRTQGRSYHAIAKMLNETNVPTIQGSGKWWPSSVREVYRRAVASA